MPRQLPNIVYTNDDNKLYVDSDDSAYRLLYRKDNDYFSNFESYVNFVKNVERTVRNSDRYKGYIAFLKNEIKLDHCQLLKDVNDNDCDIEMHHMPLSMYDICAIVLEYFLIKNWKISTFKIAKQVLNEHKMNRVGVVMLSTTFHQEYHAGKIWIPYGMVYGDISKFIQKYDKAMGNEYREKINRFIDMSLHYNPNDFTVLDLNPQLYKKT